MNTSLLALAAGLSDDALLARMKTLASDSRPRREIPDGDPASIVARALRLLRQEAERKAFAATERPREPRGAKRGSRAIPAGVRRTVWTRDAGHCAFVAKNGCRCTERSYLEYHHREPFGVGGEATVENISLRCREHNQYESELVFGPFVPRARQAPRPHDAPVALTGPGTSPLSPRDAFEREREAHL